MKMIVGLGNPGAGYTQTRHNAGFMVLDKFAATYQLTVEKNSAGLYWDKDLLRVRRCF